MSHISVFARKWTSVSAEWNDPQAEQDMASLLKMRSIVLSLLETSRGDKHLKNSVEADVDMILPDGLSAFLKTHFIVSDANITDEGSLGTGSFAWSYVSTMSVPNTDMNMEVPIRVRPSSLRKEYARNHAAASLTNTSTTWTISASTFGESSWRVEKF
ncbi:hypothetical protein M405DRAFT_912763 [Rhizopogon salebrosus TDB-379]|nr:hypothetical protein M405DRAFT_912763 [Rhizopogon salebrosus TDB-379]